MSAKQSKTRSSSEGKAKVPSTMHGRSPLVIDEPKITASFSDEDEEMNAHLSEKFRKGTYKTPKSWEQGGGERARPPHPLLSM